MKVKTFFLTLAALCTANIVAAQQIYPTVQSIKSSGNTINISDGFAIQNPKLVDPATLQELQKAVNATKGGIKLHIGKTTDKNLKKFNVTIPAISGAYYLKTSPKEIVIIGHDDRGAFYGVQTLKQLLKDNTIEQVEITDYPEVLFRGSVEGFYGKPWSQQDRLSQLKFYGQNKLNTYIYGPKDDPYHSSLSGHGDATNAGSKGSWRDAYPDKEAQQIRELAATAKQNKVDFVWAIHPGADIKWKGEEGENDAKILIRKLELMYDLGVRSFAVFFDDINGEGTIEGHRQAALMNRINNEFVKVKGDVTPLILCPTEYNKSWADPKPTGYLPILGRELDPSIQVMWTGDRVCADITMETLNWINERIQRPTYIWWNFPVTDYIRDRVLQGPSYGLATQATSKDMAGFTSNPMENAEASKIALFGVADYTWNPKTYDYLKTWDQAIKVIMPKSAQAYRTFAIHSADIGKSGHEYRREESWETTTFSPLQFTDDQYNNLKKEFEEIAAAPAIIRAANENPALIAEINPWLTQFEILGKRGLQTLDLIKLYQTGDLKKTKQAILQTEMSADEIKAFNAHKSGTLILRPFINNARTAIAEKLLLAANVNTESMKGNYIELISNIGQVKSSEVTTAQNIISVKPMLEVIKVAPQGYFGIKLPKGVDIRGVSAELNIKKPTIEYSVDAQSWSSKKPAQAQYVRFVNNSDKDIDIKLNKFEVEVSEPINDNIFILMLKEVNL